MDGTMADSDPLHYLVFDELLRTTGVSIRLRTNIKAAIFPVNFSIFFRETTFLESNAKKGKKEKILC